MSTNKSKIPLDRDYLPKPSMVVKIIDMNQKTEEVKISTGVKLVDASYILQIREEDLKMETNDITDFGEFTPTTIIGVEDVTEFPTLDGTSGIIQDSENLTKTK